MSVSVNTTNNDGWDNPATHLSAISWHRAVTWNNNFWQFFQHDCFDSVFALANLSGTGQLSLYENNNTDGSSPQVVLSSSDTSWICIARIVTTGGPGTGKVVFCWRKEGQNTWNTITMATGASGFVNPIGSTELIGHSSAQPPYNQRVSSYKGWNAVLTPAQLLTESTQSLAVIRTNLVIETSMAVGSTMGADTSGNGNNWTITQTAGDYTFNADEPNMAISSGSSYTPSAKPNARDDSREESTARSKWQPVSGQAVASQPTYSRRVAREEYQEERYPRKLWQPLAAAISGYPFARRRISEEFADELIMRRAIIVQPQTPDQPALGVWLVAEEPEAEPLPPRRIVVPVSGAATANVAPFERESKLSEETAEEQLSRRQLSLPVSGPAIVSQPIPQRAAHIDRDDVEERVARRALFVPQAPAASAVPSRRLARTDDEPTEEQRARRSVFVQPGVAVASPYVGRRQLAPSELDTEEADRRVPVVVQGAPAALAQPMRARTMVPELDGEERAPRRPLVLPSGPAVASPYVARPQRLPAEADAEETERRAPVVLTSAQTPAAYPFARRQAAQESVDEQPATRRALVQGALDPVPFSRRQPGEQSTPEERIGRRALFVQQGPAQADAAPLNRPRAAEPALPEERLGRLSPAALFATPPRIDNPPVRRNARASEDHEERPRIQRNWVVVSGVPMPALIPHFSARVPPRLWRAKVHR